MNVLRNRCSVFLLLVISISVTPICFSAAIDSVKKIAVELNDASAQYILGNMYAYGQGIEKDAKEAVKWYTKAAKQGHSEAQIQLGNIYEKGQLIKKDVDTAIRWYSKASEKGEGQASVALAKIYLKPPRKNSKLYIKMLQRGADQQHPEAQYLLGNAYFSGKGVEKQAKIAVSWWKKAADNGSKLARRKLNRHQSQINQQMLVVRKSKDHFNATLKKAKAGDSLSQYEVAMLYKNGSGTGKNPTETKQWLERAAQQGNLDAQYKLGDMLLSTDSTTNKKLGLEWLLMAAEASHALSQYRYGQALEVGEGIDKDFTIAVIWYQHAAENGVAAAQQDYQRLKQIIIKTEREEQLQRYKDRLKRLEIAAASNSAEAQFQLGLMYYKGLGVRQNLAEAVSWLKKAADQDHVKAMVELSQYYLQNDATAKNKRYAIQWLKRAASLDNSQAQYLLGNAYFYGKGVKADQGIAANFYESAAESGMIDAQLAIAKMLYEGKYIIKDLDEALRWYREAAGLGNEKAQVILGRMYIEGANVDKDYEEAERWLRQAAVNGNTQAKSLLDKIESQN